MCPAPESALMDCLAAQRQAFSRQPLPDGTTRRRWLGDLAESLLRHEDALVAAIHEDFGGRCGRETRLLELFPSLSLIRHSARELGRWMRPERRAVAPWFWPGRAQVRYQPLGVVGIIVPWNYPLFLAVGPLVAALAAGNRVMLKLPEFTPAFNGVLTRLLTACFPPDLVAVVEGGPAVAEAFSGLAFDHLLFTGSSGTGRRVMQAAAAQLTPVTLELGGKSPALITPRFDLRLAARRILFAKLLNAGQTCVAPDYVLLPAGREADFIDACQEEARRFYGDGLSQDYTALAQDRQWARITGLLADALAKGARVHPLFAEGALHGRRFPPAVLTGVQDTMAVMQEEIFGPLLPLVPYESEAAALAYVAARPRPLALYVFDQDFRQVEGVLAATASGGVTVNDCMLHVAQASLPFGGVGPSGMGRYHGVEGFRTFSQVRPVYRQSRWHGLSLFYPPYGPDTHLGRGQGLAAWLLGRMLGQRR